MSLRAKYRLNGVPTGPTHAKTIISILCERDF